MLNNTRPRFLFSLVLTACALLLIFLAPLITEHILAPFIRLKLSADGIIGASTHIFIKKGILLVGEVLLMLAFLKGIHTLTRERARALPATMTFTPFKAHKITAAEMILLGVILLSGLGVRLSLLTRGLTHDEIYTCINSIDLTLPHKIWFPFSTTNHLGATLLAWLSAKILGMSEWALRTPSLLFGMATILVLWYWIRKHTTIIIGLTAAALLSLSPIHAIWSTTLRGYSAVIFFSLLSTMFYFDQIQQPSRRRSFFLFLTNIIGVSFHFFFLLIPLTQSFHLWIMTSRKEPKLSRNAAMSLLRTLTFTLIGIFLVYSPFALLAWRTLLRAHSSSFIPAFPFILFNEMNGISLWPAGLIVFLCMIAGACYIRRKADHLTSFIPYLLILLTLSSCAWLMRPHFLYSRFFAFFLPLFLFLFSAGIQLFHEQWKKRQPLLGIFPIFIVFMLLWQWLCFPPKLATEMNSHGFRETAEFTERTLSTGMDLYAVGEADTLFTYYSKRPVLLIKTIRDYQKVVGKKTPALFLTLADMEQSDEHSMIINDLKKNGHPIRLKAINMFIR